MLTCYVVKFNFVQFDKALIKSLLLLIEEFLKKVSKTTIAIADKQRLKYKVLKIIIKTIAAFNMYIKKYNLI